MRNVVRWIAVAVTAGVIAIALTSTAMARETTVGAEAGATVGGASVDAALVHTLQTTLRSQFVGVEVALVRGRLVLTGFATPGAHTAVLAIVANLLHTPVPVPVALAVISPDLGLRLPLIDASAGIALPDLGSLLRQLGVVDHIQVIR